jgi:hypothetical protein
MKKRQKKSWEYPLKGKFIIWFFLQFFSSNKPTYELELPPKILHLLMLNFMRDLGFLKGFVEFSSEESNLNSFWSHTFLYFFMGGYYWQYIHYSLRSKTWLVRRKNNFKANKKTLNLKIIIYSYIHTYRHSWVSLIKILWHKTLTVNSFSKLTVINVNS